VRRRLKSLLGDPQIEGLAPVRQLKRRDQEDQFGPVFEPAREGRFEPREVQKKELIGDVKYSCSRR